MLTLYAYLLQPVINQCWRDYEWVRVIEFQRCWLTYIHLQNLRHFPLLVYLQVFSTVTQYMYMYLDSTETFQNAAYQFQVNFFMMHAFPDKIFDCVKTTWFQKNLFLYSTNLLLGILFQTGVYISYKRRWRFSSHQNDCLLDAKNFQRAVMINTVQMYNLAPRGWCVLANSASADRLSWIWPHIGVILE